MEWILIFFFVVAPVLSYVSFCLWLMRRGAWGVVGGLLLLMGFGGALYWVGSIPIGPEGWAGGSIRFGP